VLHRAQPAGGRTPPARRVPTVVDPDHGRVDPERSARTASMKKTLSWRRRRSSRANSRREVALLDRPQRSADFAVLTAQDVPSALIEIGCLSNPAEERLLQRRIYQQKLARGLARAVESFFAAHIAV